jgi:hypothetical protein
MRWLAVPLRRTDLVTDLDLGSEVKESGLHP